MTIAHAYPAVRDLHLPIPVDLAELVLFIGAIAFTVIAYDLYRQSTI